jgi:hypothetical protein
VTQRITLLLFLYDILISLLVCSWITAPKGDSLRSTTASPANFEMVNPVPGAAIMSTLAPLSNALEVPTSDNSEGDSSNPTPGTAIAPSVVPFLGAPGCPTAPESGDALSKSVSATGGKNTVNINIDSKTYGDDTTEGVAAKKARGRPSGFQGPWAEMMIPILDREFNAADKAANGFLYHQLAMKGIQDFGHPKKYFGSDGLYLDNEDALAQLQLEKQKKVKIKRRKAYMKLVAVSCMSVNELGFHLLVTM